MSVASWVALLDDDGPAPKPEPGHQNRNVTLVQDHFTNQWTLSGTFGSMHGANLARILEAYYQTETLADHERKDPDGPLPRTAAQRCADSFEQIFNDAICNPNRSAAVETVHNIVWSAETVEELLRRLAGAPSSPLDIDTHRCLSLRGDLIDLRGEMAELRGEMAELRSELRGEMGELRSDVRSELTEFKMSMMRWNVGVVAANALAVFTAFVL